MKVIMILIVIGVLGMIFKGLVRDLEVLEIELHSDNFVNFSCVGCNSRP